MFSQRNRELHKAIYADNYAKVIQCLQNKPAIKALLDAAAPPEKRRLAHWINRIHLHAVGPRGDHQGSARHRLLNCRHLARHLVSFLLVKGFVL